MRYTAKHLAGLAIAMVFLAIAPTSAYAQNETDAQRQMARQMAEWTNTIWNQQPDEGMANIRILLKLGGTPYAGKISTRTEFSFRAVGRRTSSQKFNANERGRWVYEGLEPGDYELSIIGGDEFAGFRWTRSITVAPGDRPILEIELST